MRSAIFWIFFQNLLIHRKIFLVSLISRKRKQETNIRGNPHRTGILIAVLINFKPQSNSENLKITLRAKTSKSYKRFPFTGYVLVGIRITISLPQTIAEKLFVCFSKLKCCKFGSSNKYLPYRRSLISNFTTFFIKGSKWQ